MGRLAGYAVVEEGTKRLLTTLKELDRFTVLDRRGHADVCPVHQTPLVPDVVPAIHDRNQVDPELRDAHRTLFPYSNNEYQIRTVVIADGVAQWQEALVLYCPACRHAETEWKKGQPGQNKLEGQNAEPQPAHTAGM